MSIFGSGLPAHKPVPMPSVMPCIPAPRCFDVEIYYNDGTDQKYFNVEWIGGNDECIILSKDENDWYIFKQAVKYIKRTRIKDEE
jgi:hypothetical protein